MNRNFRPKGRVSLIVTNGIWMPFVSFDSKRLFEGLPLKRKLGKLQSMLREGGVIQSDLTSGVPVGGTSWADLLGGFYLPGPIVYK